jgi:hypothetical protein
MRKFNVVFLLVCCCLKGMSQDKRSAQALDLVINDAITVPKAGCWRVSDKVNTT